MYLTTKLKNMSDTYSVPLQNDLFTPVVVDLEKKNEEKKTQEYHKRIETFVNIASNILTRYRNLNNPIMRHMMFIDKVYLLLDILIGTLESIDDIPPQLKQKIDKLIIDTKKDLGDLSNWIMASPDNSSNTIKNIYQDNNLEDADTVFLNKSFTEKVTI